GSSSHPQGIPALKVEDSRFIGDEVFLRGFYKLSWHYLLTTISDFLKLCLSCLPQQVLLQSKVILFHFIFTQLMVVNTHLINNARERLSVSNVETHPSNTQLCIQFENLSTPTGSAF
ncbi:MAG: hypothetical protein VCA36_13515, partial [Opitutales bacterium]